MKNIIISSAKEIFHKLTS